MLYVIFRVRRFSVICKWMKIFRMSFHTPTPPTQQAFHWQWRNDSRGIMFVLKYSFDTDVLGIIFVRCTSSLINAKYFFNWHTVLSFLSPRAVMSVVVLLLRHCLIGSVYQVHIHFTPVQISVSMRSMRILKGRGDNIPLAYTFKKPTSVGALPSTILIASQ